MNNNRNYSRGNGNFNNNRKSKEEFEAERKAKIARQTKSLEIIDDICLCLDTFLKEGTGYKITMKEILTFLTEKGYTTVDTKSVSQFNYILMDLCNARKNKNISGDRINVRVMYIQERLKSSFKNDLHDKANDILDKYDTLFAWNDEGTGEDYEPISNKKG